MYSLNSLKKFCVAGMASSLILIALTAPSANAVVDSNIYSQYQAVRSRLVVKEGSLLKDFDDLRKQMDVLNKQNSDQSLSPTLDGLSRTLDATYSDIKKIRQDIKSLDLKML